MKKKDRIFYILVAAIAFLDILIPVFIFKWQEWAPDLFSLKRIGLHLISIFAASGAAVISAFVVKSLMAKTGLIKLGVLAASGAVVTVGYVKVIKQEGQISKVPFSGNQNIVLAKDTNQANVTSQVMDWSLAMQKNTAGIYAGGEYHAKIMMYQPALLNDFAYYVNGIEVLKDKDGMPFYRELINGNTYDKDGKFRKKILITAKSKDPNNPKEFQFEDFYEVYKPYIQIQSSAVQALYLNCRNDLNVQVPALGSNYNPDFTGSTGGEVYKNGIPGQISIMPTGSAFNLKVSNNKIFIGDQSFKVRTIPFPFLSLVNGGKAVDEKMGFPAPGPRALSISVMPDESFKMFLPNEARYAVRDVTVTLARGKRPMATNDFKNAELNVSSFAAIAQPGDRLIVEIRKVVRINSSDVEEEVRLGTVIKTVPIN